MSESVKQLLLGKFTPLKKMKRADLLIECKMWRNIWDWVPSEVKYYVSRTGTQVGVNMRGPKRYIGPLLETHWTLKEIEVGCYDKVYSQVESQYYFEKKVVKIPIGQIGAFSWIAERTPEKEFVLAAEQQQEEEEEKDITI